MEHSITINITDKLPLEKLVSLHEKAREDGHDSPDDYITSLVIADLETPTLQPKRTYCPGCQGGTKLGKKEIVWKTCTKCLAKAREVKP
jgi:hypothetical protein